MLELHKSAIRDIEVDWSDRYPGDAITSVTWTAGPGLAVLSTTFDGLSTVAFVEGQGAPMITYVEVTVQTQGGRRDTYRVQIRLVG